MPIENWFPLRNNDRVAQLRLSLNRQSARAAVRAHDTTALTAAGSIHLPPGNRAARLGPPLCAAARVFRAIVSRDYFAFVTAALLPSPPSTLSPPKNWSRPLGKEGERRRVWKSEGTSVEEEETKRGSIRVWLVPATQRLDLVSGSLVFLLKGVENPPNKGYLSSLDVGWGKKRRRGGGGKKEKSERDTRIVLSSRTSK